MIGSAMKNFLVSWAFELQMPPERKYVFRLILMVHHVNAVREKTWLATGKGVSGD